MVIKGLISTNFKLLITDKFITVTKEGQQAFFSIVEHTSSDVSLQLHVLSLTIASA